MKLKIIISCLIIIIGISGCSLIPDKIVKSEEVVRTVEVKEVKKEMNDIILDYLGTVIVNDERILFTDVSGTITRVNVAAGQKVNKDEELFMIEENEDNTISINSDIDGYVKEVFGKSRTTVQEGDPLISLNVYNHRVSFGIISKDIKKVDVGTKVNITINGVETSGRVCQISPYPDQSSKTFPAQIELAGTYDKEDYIVGAVAEIDLIIGQEEGFYIDINNVLNEGDPFVYLMNDDNRAVKKNITIKGYSKNKILIEGLNEGDKLIISGTSNLKEGQKVKIPEEEVE
ncbi:efflux RND transporter periplasmic adaptor subunit [Vallitalea guaymasensis]|uniref:HlyD family efflux transporter periplasmic adaptor subunit n=1 Tax=Vallitalea guaymasensis TaxID=1185412 RepID=A0A8J8SDP6_9FIRM|nr:HlyD family efflux transporter periplasmic adaptor subunit [Vallitalea guaymasensis]QUH30686.1 HlyD family efflux transporter periplasmic adaptor subunit [Vallitalea guaymasensis]